MQFGSASARREIYEDKQADEFDFKTEAEMVAFIQGMDAGDGWDGHEVIEVESDCPSHDWDKYCAENDNPQAEIISEWVLSQICEVRNRIGGTVELRRHFDPKNGWPDDPQEAADEITNFICDSGILTEAALLLAKLHNTQHVERSKT